MSGKQIKLFLVDGTPGGLTTAEITNWTGSVVSARRSELAELLRREEASAFRNFPKQAVLLRPYDTAPRCEVLLAAFGVAV